MADTNVAPPSSAVKADPSRIVGASVADFPQPAGAATLETLTARLTPQQFISF
jgi:hypothetical protein